MLTFHPQGMTTCMKTVEVTRPKNVQPGARVPGTMEIFLGILRKDGIRGVNRGVNAVALRQISGWASRIGIARFAEGQIRTLQSKPADAKIGLWEKMTASTIRGALSCWNQPFEVSQVMQGFLFEHQTNSFQGSSRGNAATGF
jgi:hypothetical protein